MSAVPPIPFPPTSLLQASPATARLRVDWVAGASTVTTAQAANPLKLLTPIARGPSAWVCLASYGGGWLAGDVTRLETHLGPSARCFVGSQSSTKIYRNPGGRPCSHHTLAEVEDDALLVFAPDPVQPFAGSRYFQSQEFNLHPRASLVLVDSVSAGRSARGERWAFERFESRTSVRRQGELTFHDALRLDPAEGPLDSPHRLGAYDCLAFLLWTGPAVRAAAEASLAAVAALPVAPRPAFLAAASPLPDGALIRFAARQVETVGRALREHLGIVRHLLGDNPWNRKW